MCNSGLTTMPTAATVGSVAGETAAAAARSPRHGSTATTPVKWRTTMTKPKDLTDPASERGLIGAILLDPAVLDLPEVAGIGRGSSTRNSTARF